MKDGIDMVLDIISLINIPEITSAIDGKIYANIPPNGSNKTDILVSSLYLNSEEIQAGLALINIKSPILTSSGRRVVDQNKLHQLMSLIKPYVDNQYKSSFWTFLVQTLVLKDTDGSHFASMRIKYHSIQNRQVEV